jgi:hypothetical protein
MVVGGTTLGVGIGVVVAILGVVVIVVRSVVLASVISKTVVVVVLESVAVAVSGIVVLVATIVVAVSGIVVLVVIVGLVVAVTTLAGVELTSPHASKPRLNSRTTNPMFSFFRLKLKKPKNPAFLLASISFSSLLIGADRT